MGLRIQPPTNGSLIVAGVFRLECRSNQWRHLYFIGDCDGCGAQYETGDPTRQVCGRNGCKVELAERKRELTRNRVRRYRERRGSSR